MVWKILSDSDETVNVSQWGHHVTSLTQPKKIETRRELRPLTYFFSSPLKTRLPCSPSPVPSAPPSLAQATMPYVHLHTFLTRHTYFLQGPSTLLDRKEHELKGFRYAYVSRPYPKIFTIM